MASLSALDLLSMPDNEQLILRCLNKQPQLTVLEIAAVTRLPIEELEIALEQMVGRAQLVEQLRDGKRTFSVRFSRQPARQVRNLPADLLAILEQPTDTFLAQVPLTAVLTPQALETLMAESITRKLFADEVFIWQGKPFNQVGLVRTGLLKKSRLQGKHQAKQTTGYVRQAEWFGLSEMLNGAASLTTFTAATESELILWPVKAFLDFVKQQPELNLAISRLLSAELQQCLGQHVRGLGRLWLIDSVAQKSGATLLATNLAVLASQNGLSDGHSSRVVLWNVTGDVQSLQSMLAPRSDTWTDAGVKQDAVIKHSEGLDVLVRVDRGDYPPQAQLDILLTQLQMQYDYIICDLGAGSTDDFTLRLCGQAETLITLMRKAEDLPRGRERHDRLQTYARPNQRRIFALNRVPHENGTPLDPAFHLALPEDAAGVQAAQSLHVPVVEAVAESALGQALREVYRRLSLTHVIGIFIPSTIDVNQSVDNTTQVQATLAFLGDLFGGAISNKGNGVWRSEESGLVTEQVTVVRAFVSRNALEKHLDAVVEFATNLKKEMKQEAVAIDIDNQLVLV